MNLPVGRIFTPFFSGKTSSRNPSISSSTMKVLRELDSFPSPRGDQDGVESCEPRIGYKDLLTVKDVIISLGSSRKFDGADIGARSVLR